MTAAAALCQWCAMPLPDREPGQMGRPRITHAGACNKAHRNRKQMDARVERFVSALGARKVDRSDVFLPIATVYDPSEVYDQNGSLSGFQPMEADPIAALRRSPNLIAVMRRHEEDSRAWRKAWESERELAAAEEAATPSIQSTMPAGVYEAALARGVARWKNRSGSAD